MKFEEAYKRLQEIHELLKSDDIVDIDQIIELQSEAQSCYELCKDKLHKAEQSSTK